MSTFTVYALLSYNSDALTFTASGNTTTTQVGVGAILNIQDVGTTAEALVLGDLTTVGAVFIKNTDATNYVEIDSASAMDKFPQKLLPGESMILRPQTVTIYAKANTAACALQIGAVKP
jgi:hypothetical protein